MKHYIFAVGQFDNVRADGIWVSVWCDDNEIAVIDTTHKLARVALQNLFDVCVATQTDFRVQPVGA